MRVLVLGCGPAGLMAAHAYVLAGHDVLIYSRKRKSEMYGAQYLHAPIPGMTAKPAVKVSYILEGSVEGYRKKVYGSDSKVQVSPQTLDAAHDGWDIRETYANLWDTYGAFVQNIDLNPGSYAELVDHLVPDQIASTVPRPLLCNDEAHSFMAQHAWAIGDAPERGIFSPVNVAKNHVICNGEETPGWYRASTIFGYSTVEWPYAAKPPYANVAEIIKPLRHTCTCNPNVLYLGRFGEWNKGVLSHEAFAKAAMNAAAAGVQGTLL